MKRRVVFALALAASQAHAERKRVAPNIAPWILRTGTLRLDATLEMEMSSEKVGKPLALTPDLWAGISDSITLGFVHSRFAATGFRGSAGGAFCVTGTPACSGLYNHVGIEGWGALLRGTFSLVMGGGADAVNIEKGFYSGKLGLKVKIASPRISLTLTPSVLLALTRRDDMTPNTDQLYVPVGLSLKLTPEATIGVGSGIKGPVKDFADKWSVPVGVNASYAVGNVAFGAAWTFGTMFSPATNAAAMAPIEGVDLRVLQFWLSYSMVTAPMPKRSAPPVEIVDPEPEWITSLPTVSLPETVIESAASMHSRELMKCEGAYEVRGDVVVTFEVSRAGKVLTTKVASTIDNPHVSDCIARQLKSWQFPRQPNPAKGVYSVSFQ